MALIPRHWLLGMAPLGLAIAVAACGGSGTTSSQIQSDVTARIKTTLNTNDVAVTCPSDAQAEKGARFRCQANVGGQEIPFNVVFPSGSHFDANPTKAVIVASTAAGMLKQQISEQLHVHANVVCGSQKLIIKSPGETFDCQATAQGQARTFRLTVTDVQGHVAVALSPATDMGPP